MILKRNVIKSGDRQQQIKDNENSVWQCHKTMKVKSIWTKTERYNKNRAQWKDF